MLQTQYIKTINTNIQFSIKPLQYSVGIADEGAIYLLRLGVNVLGSHPCENKFPTIKMSCNALLPGHFLILLSNKYFPIVNLTQT